MLHIILYYSNVHCSISLSSTLNYIESEILIFHCGINVALKALLFQINVTQKLAKKKHSKKDKKAKISIAKPDGRN